MATTLPHALDAALSDWQSSCCGRLAYYADSSSDGTPLLLLHSINAAPSAYEMKPLFEHYRGRRPVYVLELPGFGHSERRDRRYDAQLFADAIRGFVDEVIQPRSTRVRVSRAFASLRGKTTTRPWKKHDNIPL